MTSAKKAFITIDVGNSRIKVGYFVSSPSLVEQKKLPKFLKSEAINFDEPIPWQKLASWNDGKNAIDAVILGGANPRGRDIILDGWPATGWPDPVVIDNPFSLPIKIEVNAPRTVGVDRLFNAIACNVIREPGVPMIVIDSGTATTVDVVSCEGSFMGGAILPGYQLNARALHQYTALLPHISNRELARSTPPALGKNTREALRSGLFWGQLGAIKELVRLLSSELAQEPEIVITGGAGRLMIPQFGSAVKHEPFLALQGLVIVGHHLLPQQV